MQEPLYDEDADKQLLYKNSEVIIGNVIDQLSPQRPKVFYQHHHYGFSHAGIAQHLGLSKNTVRNHLFASLEFLRKSLSNTLELMVLFSLFKKIFFTALVYAGCFLSLIYKIVFKIAV